MGAPLDFVENIHTHFSSSIVGVGKGVLDANIDRSARRRVGSFAFLLIGFGD